MNEFCSKSTSFCEVDTLEGVEPCLADIEAEVERLAGATLCFMFLVDINPKQLFEFCNETLRCIL